LWEFTTVIIGALGFMCLGLSSDKDNKRSIALSPLGVKAIKEQIT